MTNYKFAPEVKPIKYTCGVCSNKIKYIPGAGTSTDLIKDIKKGLAFPTECTDCFKGLCDDCVISTIDGHWCYECYDTSNGEHRCKHCGRYYKTILIDKDGVSTCLICDTVRKSLLPTPK